MKKNERTLPLEEDKKASIGNRNYFFLNFVLRRLPWQYLMHMQSFTQSLTQHQKTQSRPNTERHKHNYLGNKNTMCLNYLILLQVIICNVFGN